MTLEMEPPTVAARPREESSRVESPREESGLREESPRQEHPRVESPRLESSRQDRPRDTSPRQVDVPTRRPVVHRTQEERRADRLAAARRVEAALHIAVVTLAWLVLVPFLLGWGVLGAERSAGAIMLAALLAIVLPFTAAVLATRVALFFTAGCYAVLTLIMIIPAVGIVRAG